jgi:hypothetical protein
VNATLAAQGVQVGERGSDIISSAQPLVIHISEIHISDAVVKRVGQVILDDLFVRIGIRDVLTRISPNIMNEIRDTIGKKALIAAYESIAMAEK